MPASTSTVTQTLHVNVYEKTVSRVEPANLVGPNGFQSERQRYLTFDVMANESPNGRLKRFIAKLLEGARTPFDPDDIVYIPSTSYVLLPDRGEAVTLHVAKFFDADGEPITSLQQIMRPLSFGKIIANRIAFVDRTTARYVYVPAADG